VERADRSHAIVILVSKQDLEEADRLARRIAVIDDGRKIAGSTNPPLSLTARPPGTPGSGPR
jgi:ABC-type multidrug transport system ATPase subunit